MTIHRFPRIWLSATLLGMLCAACGGGTGATGTGGAASSTGSDTTTSSAGGRGGDGSTTATATTGSTASGTGGAAAVCGDGTTDPGEECDDGANNADTGACTKACKKAACGDGFKQMGEDCDEGAKNADTGTCTTKCKAPACGDGFTQAGEECDMGMMNADTGACTSMCKTAKCGDSLVGPTEGCDLGAMNSDTGACTTMCKSATCGDALLQSMVEQCDLGTGNNLDTGACTTMCKTASCGDGFIRAGIEECDMAAMNADTGACTAACKTAKCGDSLVQTGTEECDLGAANLNTGACTLACKSAKCGDGFKQGMEPCDDGNMVNGDGCNTNCVVSGTPLNTVSDGFSDAWYQVAKDPSGNVIAVGAVTVAGQGTNGIVQKYDTNGNILWMQQYNVAVANGDDSANSVTTDSAGNVIVVGTETTVGGGTDIWVRKYTSVGGTVWTQHLAGAPAQPTFNDIGAGVAVNAANDVFVSGSGVTVLANGFDILVFKLSGATGAQTWVKTVNGTAVPAKNDFGAGIAVDAAGNVLVTGAIENSGIAYDIVTQKYLDMAVGAPLWSRTVPGAVGDSYGNSITTDAANNVFVAGTQTITGQGFNTWIRKYDAGGTTVWTAANTSNTTLNDEALGIALDPSGTVVVAGYTTLPNMKTDVWVQKYSAAGVQLPGPSWPQTYNGAADGDDVANGVVVDATGNIFVVGTETTTMQGQNAWLRKYAP